MLSSCLRKDENHLLCAQNNPVTAKLTKRCPFNAKHVIPSVELSFHKMMCPDRAIVDREILHGQS